MGHGEGIGNEGSTGSALVEKDAAYGYGADGRNGPGIVLADGINDHSKGEGITMLRAVARFAHYITDGGVSCGILPVKGHIIDTEIGENVIVLLFIFLVTLEAVGGEANVGEAELAFQNHLHVIAIGVLIGSKSGGLLQYIKREGRRGRSQFVNK